MAYTQYVEVAGEEQRRIAEFMQARRTEGRLKLCSLGDVNFDAIS